MLILGVCYILLSLEVIKYKWFLVTETKNLLQTTITIANDN